MRRRCFALSIAPLVLFATRAAASPKIGDKAPPVKVAEWLTHKPPALPGGPGADRHVFLVEFWATWCPPCLRSIPHLEALQKKHKTDGLIVLGVSNEEPATIRRFIEKKVKMTYAVGSDDDMATSAKWTDDIQTIPHAFLVNRKGIVVWHGNPAGDTVAMDRVIRAVLDGKFDLEAARNAATTDKKFKDLMAALQPAFATRDEDKVFKLLDQMIALKPDDLQPYLIKRNLLREFDHADRIPAVNTLIEGHFKDRVDALVRLVRIELNTELGDRSPGLMLRCALRANAISKGRDAEVLAALARVQGELGLIDAAIDSQEQAVALAQDGERPQYKRVLTYYQAVKSVRDAQRATPHVASEASD